MAFGDLIRRGEREREASLRTAKTSVQPTKDEGLGLLGTTPGYRRESARLAGTYRPATRITGPGGTYTAGARGTPQQRLAAAGAKEAELKVGGLRRLARGEESPLFTGIQRVSAPYKEPYERARGRAEAGITRLEELQRQRVGPIEYERMRAYPKEREIEVGRQRWTNYAVGKAGKMITGPEGEVTLGLDNLDVARAVASVQSLGSEVSDIQKQRIIDEAVKKAEKTEKTYGDIGKLKKFLVKTEQAKDEASVTPEQLNSILQNKSAQNAQYIEEMTAEKPKRKEREKLPVTEAAAPGQNLRNYLPWYLAPLTQYGPPEAFPKALTETLPQKLGELYREQTQPATIERGARQRLGLARPRPGYTGGW